MMTKNILTRGTKKIITEAITRLPMDRKANKYAICEEVAYLLVLKFVGDIDDEDFVEKRSTYRLLEYQSERMGLSSTFEIMNKIDLYMINLLKCGRKELDI